MAEVINSLFGITPESLQAQRDQALQQEAMQYAKMDPFQRATAGIYTGASRLGGAIGGMLGAQDPAMAQAAQRQSLLQQTRPQDASGWKSLAQQLWQSKDVQGAQEALAKAQALEAASLEADKTRSIIAKNTADQKAAATPADIQKAQRIAAIKQAIPAYEQAGDTTSAQLLKNELKSLEPAASLSPFGKLLTEAGIAEGSDQYKKLVKDFADATLAGEKKGKGTTITNVVGKNAGDIVSLRKDVQATTKPYQDQLDAATDAIELANNAIKTGNFATVSTLSRSLAKAAGETQLSRTDVEAFGADPSLVGGISDTVARLSKGRPTVDTLTKLRDLATILQAKADKKLSLEEQQTRNVAKASGNYSDAQIDTIFSRRPKPEIKTEFVSMADAEAANLPKGTIITINGRRARVE